MILIDFNQLCISSYTSQPNAFTKDGGSFFRHCVLNSLRSFVKFRQTYGNIVLCCDGRNYWRRDVFTHYKAHRKVDREKSPINWKQLFQFMSELKEEIKQFFPYHVVEVDRCEADDVIATLIENFPNERCVIISSDNDFCQLQRFANCDQYNPRTHEFVLMRDYQSVIHQHCIQGDRGDGIPNFLSDDDTFVNPLKRQKKITEKIRNWSIDQCMEYSGYLRNKQLIDLSYIPKELVSEIIVCYNQPLIVNDRQRLLEYFSKHKLSQLTHNIGDF
jgi:hypothetical protein